MRAALVLLATACLAPAAGCGRSGDADKAPARPVPPVVVYVASGDDAYLSNAVRDYQIETGAVVMTRHGAADAIVADEIANRVEPPADVLVTRSVADIQRAASHGALRPLAAAGVDAPAPAWLRDPDGYWTGLGDRIAVVAFDPNAGIAGGDVDYAALAERTYAGRLCLSSSRNALNRAVIAQLIAARGVRSAELVVRAWITNLAQPVFESDTDVVDAIAAGRCTVGIVSSAVAPESRADVAVAVPMPAFADADAAGIGRHARNPDGAAAFVDWLLAREAKRRAGTGGREVKLATWYFDDAVKLAERAHYP